MSDDQIAQELQQELQNAFNELVMVSDVSRQKVLCDQLRKMTGRNFYELLSIAISYNPFINLSEEDRPALHDLMAIKKGLTDVFILKQIVAKMGGRRMSVFCMPKSGSSFTQSAIQFAMNISNLALTTHVPGPVPSILGMNGRTQELDELGIIAGMLRTGGSFVAQHHTKCTPYLCSQLRFYNIMPIITVRNVFDAIVSADDMYCKWRIDNKGNWIFDSQFMLPLAYENMARSERLALLARTLGMWLIEFVVSWKRCEKRNLTSPLWISYERDVSDKAAFTEKVSRYLSLDSAERVRLAEFANNPDAKASRLNKGVVGRGEAVPGDARKALYDYAGIYQAELGPDDLRQLFGDFAY